MILKNGNKFVTADSENRTLFEGVSNDLRCSYNEVITNNVAVGVICSLQISKKMMQRKR